MVQRFYRRLLFELGEARQIYLFRRPVLIALCIYCAGIVGAKKAGLLDKVSASDPAHWIGERAAVTGVVAGQPDPRPTGCVYRVDAETLDLFTSHERHSLNGQILIQVMTSTDAVAAPGDRIRVVGRIQRPKAALTPGAFDYQDYLATQGVRTVMYTSPHSFENLGASGAHDLMKWGWALKQNAVRIFDCHLSGEQSTVLSGLAVGSRPRFHPEIRDLFVESGTMHVLVASGSNVAFVIAMWFVFARLIRIPRRWALASALPAIWGYVLVAGADAPIARAGLMGTIGILAYLLDREDRPYHALGLTALLILIANPRALFDIGFQMSFGTVFGLIYYLAPLEKVIERAPLLTRWPLRLFAATMTAQIWIAPITASTFQRFFPVSILSNIVVVPLSGLGLTAGFAVAVADSVSILQRPLIFLVRLYLNILIYLVRFFATQWGTSVWVAPPHPCSVVGFLVCCLSVVGVRRSLICRIVFGTGLFFIAIGALFSRHDRSEPTRPTVDWIDNGKRLTVLIQTTGGEKLMINPGPVDPVDTTERTLMPFLTRQGITSLDAVIITDPDRRRTEGVSSLIKWVHVSTVIYCDASVLWFSDRTDTFLFAERLTTKTQRALLDQNLRHISVLATHFPRNWIWLPDFLERYRPTIAVEPYSVNEFRPSVPPWKNVELVVPQTLGWYRWQVRHPRFRGNDGLKRTLRSDAGAAGIMF